MSRPLGNARLRAARQAKGYRSQQDLADALTASGLTVSGRQVRRWESDNPPLPYPDLQRALVELLGVTSIEDLGFPAGPGADAGRVLRTPPAGPMTVPNAIQPASAASAFAAVTRAHRRLYWTVAPATLHPSVAAHATLGGALLPATAGVIRRTVASALAESWLLAGRIEFFDLSEPGRARETWLRALQAAGDADDALLGAAILAHTAFVPGWAGDRAGAAERMAMARTSARRGPASAELLAWLDAVEAECETRCGNTRTALNLIAHGEDLLAAGGDDPSSSPDWMDWFSAVRLAAFKGNVQLRAGHLPQARETLLGVMADLPADADKQMTVVLGDLAAVEAAAGQPEAACDFAIRALDLLETHWYATGMERVREVRRELAQWQGEPCVRALDDRLFSWSAMLSALAN
ncbi:helix-turn-helix domain-containing protein [Streptomyces sp. NBC_01565]|uniref:helix-turn-helix domain-containing protein n=1 Tax=Streptomyces sp. NBC_01565 TaxID=2975881 RepID=UPI002254A17F|nr:helix-turn-helix domain-containing protein [Streptomyces sp. NBC_01565]MCX4543748.1 helix-turn-helix domain-containing protein [Streptomyces sp. NBC_01565]